jgi:hypothetical protein
MTLKEKFHQWLKTDPFGSKDRVTLREAECEAIAEEFAIEFAEWCVIRKVSFFDDTEQGMIFTVDLYKTKYTTKELLQIYKKEKGL